MPDVRTSRSARQCRVRDRQPLDFIGFPSGLLKIRVNGSSQLCSYDCSRARTCVKTGMWPYRGK